MISTYLNYPGQTREAFEHYEYILGGELQFLTYADMPMEGFEVSDNDKNKIAHACLTLKDGSNIMASDQTEGAGPELKSGNNFHLYLPVESRKEADRVFKALSKGGKELMPMDNVPWGAYFGMLVDKFGIQWMISFSSHD
jgi:PhnB protein